MAKAYVDEKWLRLFFDENAMRGAFCAEYNQGAALTGFLRVDTDCLSQMYDGLISGFLNVKAGRLSENDALLLSEKIAQINAKSPYLTFYTDILASVLLSLVKGKVFDMTSVFSRLPGTNELYEQYMQRFEKDCENVDEILSPYYLKEYLDSRPAQQKAMMLRSINNILSIKEAIMLDIADKRASLSEELELLYDGEAEDALSRRRKLALFDLERGKRLSCKPFYAGSEFSVFHELLVDGLPAGEGFDIKGFAEDGAGHGEIGLYGLYGVNWVDDLIRLEFLKSLENDVLIKKCENCGRLFAPAGRIDTIYCGDIYWDSGKTCAEIGAVKKYRDKTESDPVHEAFNKAYKRNNSRVRNNKITKSEFKDWLFDARIQRTACSTGSISLAEFVKWLGNKK